MAIRVVHYSHRLNTQYYLLLHRCQADVHIDHLGHPPEIPQSGVVRTLHVRMLLCWSLCLRLGRTVARFSTLLFRRLCCSPGICCRRFCYWRHDWMSGHNIFLCIFWLDVRITISGGWVFSQLVFFFAGTRSSSCPWPSCAPAQHTLSCAKGLPPLVYLIVFLLCPSPTLPLRLVMSVSCMLLKIDPC
jgi:hypothetical protein